MKVLIINCGSSSLKYQVMDMSQETVLVKGLVEKIGSEEGILTQIIEGQSKEQWITPIKDHYRALELVLEKIPNLPEIKAVGHRVVHGGEIYNQSVKIDETVIENIRICQKLAPLHNSANLIGIEVLRELMPNVEMVAVFDTAFHQTLPEKAYRYPLPVELYEKYGIRKYGFHGTSHQYVAERAAKALQKDLKNLKLISCHLGSGSSVTAIKNGQSVETSMGFTPLEGVCMGTRSGTIDPSIVTYLINELYLSTEQVDKILNHESGLYGLSQISNDYREVQEAAELGNPKAQLALEVFHYKIQEFIGAYTAVLNGVDCIIFTAGIGENSAYARREICKNFKYLGVKIDETKNQQGPKEREISTVDSKVKVWVIPTNEELMIAKELIKVIDNK